jgi:hypothetical protein
MISAGISADPVKNPTLTPHSVLHKSCTTTTKTSPTCTLTNCAGGMQAPSIPLSSQCLMQAHMSTHLCNTGNTLAIQFDTIVLESNEGSPRTEDGRRKTEVCAPT